MEKLKVAVLFGGPSLEHDVSVESGKRVLSGLSPEKYEAFPVHIKRDGEWPIDPEELARQVDLAFIALHGKYGEDGTVQEFLERLDLPYTGSGVLASALGMNKILSYRLFQAVGLNVPRFEVINRQDADWRGGYPLNISIDLPLIIKPANQGSSLGVSLVRKAEEVWPAVEKALQFGREAIVQEYIDGQEFAGSVLEMGEKVAALEPLQILPLTGEFFDYQSKYSAGASEERVMSELLAVREEIQQGALRAHKAIGACGFSRSDFILASDGRLYILEINTVPGLTKNSLFPKAAEASGISFPRLLDVLVEQALKKEEVAERE